MQTLLSASNRTNPKSQLRHNPPETMTVEEVGDFLNVSRWTVYDLVSAGKIRSVRVGQRRLLFRLADVRHFLEKNSK